VRSRRGAQDGAWDEGCISPDGHVTIHALSNALNYGQVRLSDASPRGRRAVVN
jgi:hypothetical protein